MIRATKPIDVGHYITVSIHSLTSSLDEFLDCWQCFMFLPMVESTSQQTPAGKWRVLDKVVNNCRSIVWPLLSYLFTLTPWHSQNVLTQCILFNWCSNHGDITMSQAGIWGIRRQRIYIMCIILRPRKVIFFSFSSPPAHTSNPPCLFLIYYYLPELTTGMWPSQREPAYQSISQHRDEVALTTNISLSSQDSILAIATMRTG